MPADSLILFIRHSQEDRGAVLFPDEIAQMVSQASPVPVYGVSDFYLGSGVVGGVDLERAAWDTPRAHDAAAPRRHAGDRDSD